RSYCFLFHPSRGISSRSGDRRREGLLLREELISNIAKCLELNGISAWVQQKHCRLFPDLSLESRVRFYDKSDAGRAQAFGELIELRNFQDSAEVRHRYVVAIHNVRVAVRNGGVIGSDMTNELMPKEVEIHPRFCAPTFGAAEHFAIKAA